MLINQQRPIAKEANRQNLDLACNKYFAGRLEGGVVDVQYFIGRREVRPAGARNRLV